MLGIPTKPDSIIEGRDTMEHREIVTCHFSTIRSQSMHFHQAVEIVYLLDGILELRYESEQHVLRPNEFLLINSNVRHEYQGKGDVLLASLRIDYRQLTDLFHGEQLYFLCDSAKAEEASAGYAKLRRCVWQIFQYEQSREGQANAYRNSLYYQMIYILSSEFLVKKELQGHDFRRGNQSERMKEIFDFLTMNYREQISLQKLADQLFLSPTYLSRYIKKNLNMSFLKLLQNIRLEYAVEELVRSDKTVLKIAMDNGFSGITGFNRSFQESYGMSPTEYRQKQQESSRKEPSMELTEEMQKKIDDFLLANGAVEAETSDQDVSILEADCRERETLAKNWNQVLNIGKAQDLLRYDVCGQVRFLQKSLRFQYGRVWNVLSDEMMIRLGDYRTEYNFSLLDKEIDFLIETGLTPFLELGFRNIGIMANYHTILTEVDYGEKFCSLESNKGFLTELMIHWLKRYGPEQVRHWKIGIENNSGRENYGSMDKYLETFDAVASIFKSYVPELKIGSTGLCLNFHGDEFRTLLEIWRKRGAMPDFIGLNSFPYLWRENPFAAGKNPYTTDADFLYHLLRQTRELIREKGIRTSEIYVLDWSFTLSNRNVFNDSCFNGAYIMKNLIQNREQAKILSYWEMMDLMYDYTDTEKGLFGGGGILTKGGICKPAYYAFDFMNRLKKDVLAWNDDAVISGDGEASFFICCPNYKHFNFRYYLEEENEIEAEHQYRFFENTEKKAFLFRIHNVHPGEYRVKIYTVNQEHGNIQNKWMETGFENEPASAEMDYLRAVTRPGIKVSHIQAENGTLVIETCLNAQEIQGIEVMERW